MALDVAVGLACPDLDHAEAGAISVAIDHVRCIAVRRGAGHDGHVFAVTAVASRP